MALFNESGQGNFRLCFDVGKFSRTSYDEGADYAMAAPSAEQLHGAVYICPNCFDDNDKDFRGSFSETIIIKGHQIGERFGHSLCSVDINGDGYDDLVVGAPLHTEHNLVRYSNFYL